jgi:hypothetical protein
MAPQQLHGAIDDLGSHRGLRQIGHPENQCPSWLKPIQRGSGQKVVRLTGLGVHLRQAFNQLPQMSGAASWQYALLNAVPIGYQADAIT